MLGSCKKDTVKNINLGLNLIKVFDDSLAKADNESMRICAGKDRLYMTYGVANALNYINGSINIEIARCKLMVTNNKGELIWKYSLPDNIEMGSLIELNDGGCLVAASNKNGYYDNFNPKLLFLFRFTKNGQLYSTDSISAPGSATASTSFKEQNLFQMPNGNILIYGSFFKYDASENQDYGFACEYNLNGSVSWIKSYQYPFAANNMSTKLTGCQATADGGYIFVGDINEVLTWNIAYSKIFVLKTNAVGDTIWTKFFNNKQSAWCRNIIPSANGNFWFAFNSTINDKVIMNLYEVNSNGDSINSKTIDVNHPNYVSVILSKDGGIFTLLNTVQYAIPYYQAFNYSQINTMYLQLKADLSISKKGTFQNSSNDLLVGACKTSEGSIACFGLMQTYMKGYYKPELIILK